MNPIDISTFEQIKASGNLPSPKGVALAIMRLTQKEGVSMAELARIIKSDPAFVGRHNTAPNSVNANPGRPVVSVQGALVVLGIPAVRNMALGFSLLSQYKQGACKAFDYPRFWSGSLACAIAVQALTLRTRAAQADEAFSVGLLARIGELALATLYPEDFDRIQRAAGRNENAELVGLERERFALTHRELTAAMLADWGVPKIYCDPVFHHENPDGNIFTEGSREYMLLQSLALARGIAHACLAAEDEHASHLPRLLQLGRRLSMDSEELLALCDGIAREWKEWAAILNVMTQPVPSFAELAEAQGAPAAQAVAQGADAQRLRVLLVGEAAAMRAALQDAPEPQGHELFTARDGLEGISAALDCQPHMIVADLALPKMDGLALTRALRDTRVGRDIYILLLAPHCDEGRLVEAFDAGADDCMDKPLTSRLLSARLHAGRRIVRMHREIESDREEIRRYAAELAITNRRLQEAALTDALTGFPNRRYAMERVQQEWAATARSMRPLACMVIDLDRFKQVNDTYGHDVGDTYLTQTAAAIRNGLRVQDVVCRTGGDEFLVICPDTDLPAAMACAERMRRAVESAPVKAGVLQLKATMSVGVAVRDVAMPDADALIKRADQGVYMAKQRGRNRIASPQITTH
jgi:diguanylate cyclase (GGDEF)-like protein